MSRQPDRRADLKERWRSGVRVLSACLAASLSNACAPVGEAPDSDLLAITGVTLLDGRGGDPKENVTVVVHGDRIQSVLADGQRPPAGGRRVDGRGKYLTPGFIDMHAHLMTPRCDGNFDKPVSERMIGTLLDFGVTTIRSPGNPTVEGLRFRDALNAGLARGPQAVASAEIVNDPKMTEAELRAYVRDALPYRPDYFKFHSRMPPSSVAVFVDEAHSRRVPVIGHLQATSTVDAIRIGVDHVTHAVDWSPAMLRPTARQAYAEARKKRDPIRARLDWLELLELDSPEVSQAISALARSGVSMDPTLVAYDTKFRDPASPRYRRNRFVDIVPELHADWRRCQGIAENWTKDDHDRWGRSWPKLLAYVRRLHEAGVLLTTGSDITNPWVIPGESLHQEMELLVEAGIRPAAVLKMSGENAARALGRKDVGVVEPGRRADLVLLSADPIESIANTRKIVWVMQGGRLVSQGPVARAPE